MTIDEGHFTVQIAKIDHLIGLRRPHDAFPLARNLVHSAANRTESHQMMAAVLLEMGEFWHSAVEAKQAVALDPGNFAGYLLLGAALNGFKDPKQAADVLDQGLNLMPDSVQLHREKAKSLLEIGRKEEALKYALEAVAIDPEDELNHEMIGYVLMEIKQYQTAAAAYEEALKKFPENPVALNNLALIRLQQNRSREAVQLLNESLRIDPTRDYVKKNLATAIKARNRVYGLFWQFSRLISRMHPVAQVTFIWALLVLDIFIQIFARRHPEFSGAAMAIHYGYFAFCVYTWLADPMFDFALKRGWLK